jgi:hypothetical protein
MKIKDKLTKADDSLTIYKLDNGYMIEVIGRNELDEWANTKILVTTLGEVWELLEEYAAMEVS